MMRIRGSLPVILCCVVVATALGIIPGTFVYAYAGRQLGTINSLKEIASAVRLLVERNRVVAEGAGGSSVAAALGGQAGKGRIVCVVSGGNLDTEVLGKILRGEVP